MDIDFASKGNRLWNPAKYIHIPVSLILFEYFWADGFDLLYHTMDTTLFEKLGEENLKILVDRFYELVFKNDQISHLFKSNKDEIKEKQRLFLTQFLGGPSLYSEKYGHPKLRARHLPHPITDTAAAAWLSCMSEAISSLSVDENVKDELFRRFIPTAMFMVNQ